MELCCVKKMHYDWHLNGMLNQCLLQDMILVELSKTENVYCVCIISIDGVEAEVEHSVVSSSS